MSSPRSDFARLLAAPDPVNADLARNLLLEAGIPSMLNLQDPDLAGIGAGPYLGLGLARPDLLVPSSALERAREVLIEAWGDQAFA